MLRAIHLKNFKSHHDTRLTLGNLTLLCGQNGVGKTSAVQSLLLLRQSFMKNRLHEGLDLNKPLCEIGAARDALYQYTQNNFIEFQLESDVGGLYQWRFAFDETNPQATFLQSISQPNPLVDSESLAFLGTKFQYLSAARLAPQESYIKDDYEVKRNRQLSLEKGQGELVAHFLHHYGRKHLVPCNMQSPQTIFQDVLSQTIAWSREISKNINFNIIDSGRGYEFKYNFAGEGGFPTSSYRPENVGFGVTYALPLIVAILSAEEDALIIIENPEAHLHPYAQGKLAELMALAAQSGIQILIETHSDHFINGVLVACKKFEDGDKGIDRENARFYFFERGDDQEAATIPIEIEIETGGKIKNQPAGFFDQIEQDLEILMGF